MRQLNIRVAARLERRLRAQARREGRDGHGAWRRFIAQLLEEGLERREERRNRRNEGRPEMKETEMTWHTPPANQGQAVLVSYSVSERGLYRRVLDQSAPSGHPGRVAYYFAPWCEVDDPEADEPWNGEPHVPEGTWVEVQLT